jgi:hypothetical protein
MVIKDLPISIFLLPLAFAFILLAFYFPKTVAIQLGIILSFASLYLGFSLFSHYKEKSLTMEVMLEYILLATLVIVMISGITF